MKKILTVFAVLLAIAGTAGSVYFYMQYSKVSTERETLVQQNAVLQSSIDAIGPTMTAYTVAAPVTTRDVIHADDFVEILIPTSNKTDDVITDLSTIEGKLYKVDIAPGATMTNSLVMEEKYNETMYDYDLNFDYLPLGLKVGDYVNIKITFPFGQTFIVTPHVRVEQVVLEANVIKAHLTAAQEELWTSAKKDFDLYGQYGLSVYLEKYVEPGVDDDIIAFYPVRKEMEAVVNVNPNIPDASVCVNSTLRSQIDYMLEAVTEEEGSILSGGANNVSSAINSASSTYEENTDTTATSSSSNSDTMNLNQASEELNQASSSLNKTDADGNASNITQEQKDSSMGDSLFGDETVLE